MCKAIYIALLFFSASVIAAEPPTPAEEEIPKDKVYKSLGPGGVPEYSDRPGKAGEVEIKLSPGSTYKPPRNLKFRPSPKRPPQRTVNYEQLKIISPTPDQTIRGEGNVAVKLQVQPVVQTGLGHRLQIVLDGRTLPENTSELKGLDRGAHTLEARIVDAQQEVIKRTSVTFHVKRHSVQ